MIGVTLSMRGVDGLQGPGGFLMVRGTLGSGVSGRNDAAGIVRVRT